MARFQLLIILNELQSSGGVFYDIGAATGYFTVLAAQTIPPTNIHVFEPANQSGVLKKNLTRYAPEATLHRRGVGNSESTIRLDDYVQTNPAPTVIKIDVDGAEDGVLAGMYRIIKESSPLVLLEVHNTANYHNICESIRNGFADAGYEFELVKRHRYAGSQRERTTLDSLVEMENSENDYLLICSPE